jgi:hypothetical protein
MAQYPERKVEEEGAMSRLDLLLHPPMEVETS